MTVFVSGPQASGKTINSAAMMRHFGLSSSIDWSASARRSKQRQPDLQGLVLTCEHPETIRRFFPRATIYTVEEMAARLGSEWIVPIWPEPRPDDFEALTVTRRHDTGAPDDLAMRRERYQRADRLAERILFAVVALSCLAIGYGLGWWL